MFKLNIIIYCLFLLVKLTYCYDADSINNLPGIEFNLTFKHYSGFLKGSETHQLHYW